MTPKLNRNPRPVPSDILDRLVRSEAISQFQADWIESIWPDLDQDAFAHPYLRAVPAHSRAALERQRLCASACEPLQPNKLAR